MKPPGLATCSVHSTFVPGAFLSEQWGRDVSGQRWRLTPEGVLGREAQASGEGLRPGGPPPPLPRAIGMQGTPSETPCGHLDIAARERLGRSRSTVLSIGVPVTRTWLSPHVILLQGKEASGRWKKGISLHRMRRWSQARGVSASPASLMSWVRADGRSV